MKERLSPREKGKRIIAASTLTVLAMLGISGCSEQESFSWKLGVDCPDGKELTAGNYQSNGAIKTFELSCGKDEAPSSIQIIESPQLKNDKNAPIKGYEVDISASSYAGSLKLEFGNPRLTTEDNPDSGNTEVTLREVDSLDKVNITHHPEGQN